MWAVVESHHVALAVAETKVKAAQANHRAQQSHPSPKIAFQISPGKVTHQGDFGVTTQVQWGPSPTRATRMTESLEKIQEATWDLSTKKQNLQTEALLHYADHLYATQMLSTIAHHMRLMKQHLLSAEAGLAAGQLDSAEVLRAHTALAQLEQRRIQIHHQQQRHALNINRLMGIPLETTWDHPNYRPPVFPQGKEIRSEAAALQAKQKQMEARVEGAQKEGEAQWTGTVGVGNIMASHPLQFGVVVALPSSGSENTIANHEAGLKAVEEQSVDLAHSISLEQALVVSSRDQVLAELDHMTKVTLPSIQKERSATEASFVAGRMGFIQLIQVAHLEVDLLETQHHLEAESWRICAHWHQAFGLEVAP